MCYFYQFMNTVEIVIVVAEKRGITDRPGGDWMLYMCWYVRLEHKNTSNVTAIKVQSLCPSY